MPDLGRLIDDHDMLDALTDRLISASRGAAATPAQCHALLAEFAAQLDAHLKIEASFLYDAHVPAPNHGLHAAVQSFQDEFSELMASWQDYVARWDETAIAADRPGFAQQTTDMMTAHKLRIARENGVIYPLAFEAGLLSSRSGA